MVSVAAAAAPESPKLVLDRELNDSFSFTLMELAEDPDLAWVLELIPPERLADLDLDPEVLVTIDLDGRVHVNAFLKESGDAYRAKVHLAWHGNIGLQVEGMPSLNIEVKNAQLMFDGRIAGDMEATDLKVNFHVNGDLTGGEGAEMDLGTHLLLKIDDGQITQLKVWLPDLVCLAESE
jgi:hypothetical protein